MTIKGCTKKTFRLKFGFVISLLVPTPRIVLNKLWGDKNLMPRHCKSEISLLCYKMKARQPLTSQLLKACLTHSSLSS
jgi:hypothetical protein